MALRLSKKIILDSKNRVENEERARKSMNEKKKKKRKAIKAYNFHFWQTPKTGIYANVSLPLRKNLRMKKSLLGYEIIYDASNLFDYEDKELEKLKLSDVLNLSIILENLVLNDKIVIFDDPYTSFNFQHRYDLAGLTAPFEKKQIRDKIVSNPILNDFFKANLIQIVGGKQTYDELRMQFYDDVKDIETVDLWTDFGVDMGLYPELIYAIQNNHPIIPHNSRTYKRTLKYVDDLNDVNTDLLIEEYNKVSESLSDEVKRLVKYGNRKTVYIPPISSLIFSRSETINDIVKNTIEIKEEFEKVRRTFAEYENTISDDSITLKESLSALNDLESIMNQINPKENSNFYSQISEWRDATNLIKLMDGVSASDASSITNLILGKPLKYATNKFKIRKVKYLFQVVNDFLEIKNYGNLIQKLFKFEIDKEQLQSAQYRGFDILKK